MLLNVKWGLLYGVILCNVCVMGEFGVVLVVLGYICGVMDMMLLYVEILYNEYNFVVVFVVVLVLVLFVFVMFVLKLFVECYFVVELVDMYDVVFVYVGFVVVVLLKL